MTDTILLESLGVRVRRFAFPVPDALLALIFALAAAIDFLPAQLSESIPHGLYAARDELIFAMMVEGGFLLMQGTLVDIATRLKKRPPIWLIPLIVGAVLLFTGGGAHEVLLVAWERGALVFVPLLLSLLERGYLLWQMPVRTRVQKMAARALISNRIVTGLALAGLLVLAAIVSHFAGGPIVTEGAWPLLLAGAVYFGIAAYDDLRVRRRPFAENPRVLFRFDVVGVQYLEPL